MYGFLSSGLLKIIASSRLPISFKPKVSLEYLHILCSRDSYNQIFLLLHTFTTSLHILIFPQILTISRSTTELNHLQTRLKSWHIMHVWHLHLGIKMHKNFLLYTAHSYWYSYSIWAKNNLKVGYSISVESVVIYKYFDLKGRLW